MGGIAALAFAVRFVPVLVGHGFEGIADYDDGVYFGSAIALVLGWIPYRDFLLLHPPGILYVLAPFAAIGAAVGDATAFALARVGFMLLGAVNAALVTVVAGAFGRRVALAAGLLYVVWPAAVLVERSTWLIAPQTTLLLLALLVVVRRRHDEVTVRTGIIAGALVGASIATQIWNAVPFVVLLAWIAVMSSNQVERRWRPASAYVVAAIVTAGALLAPFVLASGGSLFRYVVRDQVGRPPGSGSLVTKLRAIEGLPISGAQSRIPPALVVEAAFLVVLAAVAVVAWRRRDVRPFVAFGAAQLAVLVVIPPFGHYAAWLAPTAAIVLGVTVVELAEAGRRAVSDGADDRGDAARDGPSLRQVVAGVALVAYVATLVTFLAISSLRMRPRPLPTAALRAVAGNTGCVMTDEPTLVIVTGLLRRDIADGCRVLLDPTGTSYDVDRGSTAPRARRPEYQALMASYYERATTVFLHRIGSDGFSQATWARVTAAIPARSRIGPVTVLTKGSSGATPREARLRA